MRNSRGTTSSGSNLTNADSHGRGDCARRFSAAPISPPAQLYSTANYKAKDLSKIVLHYNNMATGTSPIKTSYYADLASATLTGADLSRADLRGATGAILDRLPSRATRSYPTGPYATCRLPPAKN